MARTARTLPAGSRITDYISLGVIAEFFPLEKVREVLHRTYRASRRKRDLPAHVVDYFVTAVARRLTRARFCYRAPIKDIDFSAPRRGHGKGQALGDPACQAVSVRRIFKRETLLSTAQNISQVVLAPSIMAKMFAGGISAWMVMPDSRR
jgi:hypothetical protein